MSIVLDEIVKRLTKVRKRIEQNRRLMDACFGERDDEILLLIESIKLYNKKRESLGYDEDNPGDCPPHLKH